MSFDLSEESLFEAFEKETEAIRSLPVHGKRAAGGAIGVHLVGKPMKVIDERVIEAHQSHVDQEVAHAACSLCADPSYPFRSRPMIGKVHQFDSSSVIEDQKGLDTMFAGRSGSGASEKPKSSSSKSLNKRVPGTRDISLTVGGTKSMVWLGTFPEAYNPLIRHLACQLDPKFNTRYREYKIPKELKALVPELKKRILQRLHEKGYALDVSLGSETAAQS